MLPSRRAIALVAAGLVLSVLPALGMPGLWSSWMFFWVVVVLLLAVDAALAVRARDIRTDLTLPGTLYVGADHDASIRVTAPSRTALELKVDLSDNLEAQPPQRALVTQQGVTFPLRVFPNRRGLATVENAWLRFAGPLGLMMRSVRVPLHGSASVVPNVPGVRAAALSFWSEREFNAGLKVERYVGDGSEFDALREFAPGFDRRTIDWKASARHTKLFCRQFRAERSHQVVLAVDTGRLMAEPLGGIPRLDHAVHAALLLGYFGARAGDRVSLYAFDERPRTYMAPKGGMPAFRAMLAASGKIEYSDAETNFTLGITHLASRLNRRSLVVVLTDFVDSVTAELLLENVQRLAKRHLVVFVALRDPLFSQMTEQAPRNISDLDRAVVAGSLLRERELVMRKLTRQGVFCIDALPEHVGVALINRYLEVKRREMI